MDEIGVEVVYALPAGADAARVRLPSGATVGDAIRAAAMLERHPEIDLKVFGTGIHGRLASLERVVQDGDRVEIYRPLQIDPKEARRRRAARQR